MLYALKLIFSRCPYAVHASLCITAIIKLSIRKLRRHIKVQRDLRELTEARRIMEPGRFETHTLAD